MNGFKLNENFFQISVQYGRKKLSLFKQLILGQVKHFGH